MTLDERLRDHSPDQLAVTAMIDDDLEEAKRLLQDYTYEELTYMEVAFMRLAELCRDLKNGVTG